jgi:stage II sporulation protein P
MKRCLWNGLTGLILLLACSTALFAQEELDGKYFTLKDSGGRIVCRTAHRVVVGDRYLNSGNRLYEVVRSVGMTAWVKPVSDGEAKSSLFSQVQKAIEADWHGYFSKTALKSHGPICIYHTHTDESYLPTQGVNSEKVRGGVVGVGDALAKSFEEKGIPVDHSKTSHVPHDAMAYDRSRRTAAQMLKDQPPVLLDVHRDAVPKDEYTMLINNKPTARVQLVVGRENPNFQANNEYAKRVKNVVDKQYPGLVKGIFYGKGKYNQDLGPRAMLLECGTNTNSENEAIRGVQLFAEAGSNVLYGSAGNWASNRGSLRSVFLIVLAAAVAIGLFFLLNRRGLASIGREFGGDRGNDDPDKE